ncbi:NUDIX domain-containing protein [Candidatus Woesearchaeota archaeon]|nr:NUDIX domain-containing protein [Candidatus Woesearchaeota archaeon]
MSEKHEHVVVITGIVKFKDKILLLKRNSKMEMHPNKWSFPGGKVISGETLFQALQREIKEETNLEIEDTKRYISDYTFTRPSGKNTIGFCFLVNAKNNKVKLSKEFTDFSWISPEEIENYNIIPYLKDEVKKAFST